MGVNMMELNVLKLSEFGEYILKNLLGSHLHFAHLVSSLVLPTCVPRPIISSLHRRATVAEIGRRRKERKGLQLICDM